MKLRKKTTGIITLVIVMLLAMNVVGYAQENNDTQEMTKIEFVQELAKVANAHEMIYQGIFSDIKEASRISNVLQGAYNIGLIDMGMLNNGAFLPQANITREEAVSMAVCALKSMHAKMVVPKDLTFNDKEMISKWALTYIEQAVALGLVEDGGLFNPKGTLTAEEGKKFIEDMKELYKNIEVTVTAGVMRRQFKEIPLPEGVERPAFLDEDYKLVFDDEFDGDTLDTTKWSYNYSWGRTHNHGGYATEENVIVKDGLLTIVGEKKRHPDAPYAAYADGNEYPLDYTVGVINSYDTMRYTYGYLEARFKMPKGKGMWPAWWMLSDGWPPEIDIFEVLGSTPNTLRINYHYGEDWSKHGSYYQEIGVPNMTDDFHVYGFDWTPDRMAWYFDGKQIGNAYRDKARIAEITQAYIIVNLAIDGWDGKPDASTPFPGYYQCDWMRLWQKNE